MSTTPGGMFDYVDAPYPDYAQGNTDNPTGVQAFQRAVETALSSLSGATVLSADASAVSSNTLTAQSALSKAVVNNTVYSFKIILWITATAGEGVQVDFAGGSAAMSWFTALAIGYDGSSQALISPVLTALSTVFGPQDAFSGMIGIEGAFKSAGDGTFIPRIAQTAHGSGSVQVLKGSSISVMETS